jgi:hypothetical protein
MDRIVSTQFRRSASYVDRVLKGESIDFGVQGTSGRYALAPFGYYGAAHLVASGGRNVELLCLWGGHIPSGIFTNLAISCGPN